MNIALLVSNPGLQVKVQSLKYPDTKDVGLAEFLYSESIVLGSHPVFGFLAGLLSICLGRPAPKVPLVLLSPASETHSHKIIEFSSRI